MYVCMYVCMCVCVRMCVCMNMYTHGNTQHCISREREREHILRTSSAGMLVLETHASADVHIKGCKDRLGLVLFSLVDDTLGDSKDIV